MSTARAASRRVTPPDLTPIPDDPASRVECLGGSLILSSPTRLAQQVAVGELLHRLGAYCSTIGGWFVCPAPFDLMLDPYTLAPPDLAVFRMRDAAPCPASVAEAGRPALVVEVLAARSARTDRAVSRRRYQRMGVEYLLCAIEDRTVERWTPQATVPELFRDVLIWHAPQARWPFTLDLPPFFSRFHSS